MSEGQSRARSAGGVPEPTARDQPGMRESLSDPMVQSALDNSGDQGEERAIVLAFAPLHKAAFGVATGTLTGTVLALVTLADMVIDPQRRAGLDLLSEYFYGYNVSPLGALTAFFWGAAVGFIAGWFVAFARNAVMALWILYFRARADWLATGDFLDYI